MFLHDLRLAARLLVKSKAFSAVALLVLALAIGVNTAIFSLVNALLLRPITGADPARLVGVYSQDTEKPDSYRAFSYPEYGELREAGEVFEGLLAHTFALVGLGEQNATRRAFAAVVSSNYFATLRVPLARGRPFTPEEEAPGAEIPVLVASHGLWKRLGEPELGRTLKLNGRDAALVGVAPEGFSGTMAIASPELWLPLSMYDATLNDFQRQERAGALAERSHRNLILVGLLKRGLTPESARAHLALVSERMAQSVPEDRQQVLSLAPLGRLGVSTQPISDRQPALAGAVLMAMASLVLLIGCLNLTNMLLARGEMRRKEIAVRLALGAGRAQVIRQLVTEGMLLALLGGAIGLALAGAATRLLVASLEPLAPLAIVFPAEPDWRVLSATLVFCALATLLAALGPAWKLARADALPELKEQGVQQRVVRRRFLAPRDLLVVGQLALSLALLTTGGLFVRGALAGADTDPGFHFDGQLLVEVDPALGGDSAAEGRRVYRTVIERLRALPGVEAASLGSTVPFGPFSISRRVQAADGADVPADNTTGIQAEYVVIGSDYFRTLGLGVLRGREFGLTEEQAAAGERAAIVDEPLARQVWGQGDPIGRSIRLAAQADGAAASEPLLVVGIVPGLRHDITDPAPVPHVYVPFGANYQSGMSLHLRAAVAGSEPALLDQVRGELRRVAPQLPVLSATTLARFRDDSLPLWLMRTGARMFTLFGVVALLLAVVGIYGVKSYLVACRTREIGIRIALGATRRDVLRMVLGQAAVVTGAGVLLGLALAAGSGRVVASLLYRVSPADPLVFALAPCVLAAAALLAALLPARRATRIAPIDALRSQ